MPTGFSSVRLAAVPPSWGTDCPLQAENSEPKLNVGFLKIYFLSLLFSPNFFFPCRCGRGSSSAELADKSSLARQRVLPGSKDKDGALAAAAGWSGRPRAAL